MTPEQRAAFEERLRKINEQARETELASKAHNAKLAAELGLTPEQLKAQQKKLGAEVDRLSREEDDRSFNTKGNR